MQHETAGERNLEDVLAPLHSLIPPYAQPSPQELTVTLFTAAQIQYPERLHRAIMQQPQAKEQPTDPGNATAAHSHCVILRKCTSHTLMPGIEFFIHDIYLDSQRDTEKFQSCPRIEATSQALLVLLEEPSRPKCRVIQQQEQKIWHFFMFYPKLSLTNHRML